MKYDTDKLMALIRRHFRDDSREALIFTRWKDGIDVDYPTAAIEMFAEEVRREAIKECADAIAVLEKQESELASAYCVGMDGYERHEAKSARHAARAGTLTLATAAVLARKDKPNS